METRYEIFLTSSGDCWMASASVRCGDECVNVGGHGFDEREHVAIIEALTALGRSIASHRMAERKRQEKGQEA